MQATTQMAGNGLSGDRFEVSVKGKWVSVPAMQVGEQVVTVRGRWIRIASVHDEEWAVEEVDRPSHYLESLKEPGAPRADLFTFTQKVPDTGRRFDYAFEPFSVAAAEVSDFQKWWDALPQETRKNVRRAQKRGIVVRIESYTDELVRGIAGIQNEARFRQGRLYPHYGKSFDQVKRDHVGFVERSDFIGAYCGEELVGFLKLVYRGNIASILQLNSKIAHYDKRPSNALLAKAVELCSAKGVSYMTYGRFNYGNKDDSSLRDFKIRNGFRDFLIPRYYVPLTLWGEFCVRARLYRGVMEILPGSVIRALTGLRAKLYSVSLFHKPV